MTAGKERKRFARNRLRELRVLPASLFMVFNPVFDNRGISEYALKKKGKKQMCRAIKKKRMSLENLAE